MSSRERPDGNRTPRPLPCMAHFVPHYPGSLACSTSHWLESEGAVLCKPETPRATVGLTPEQGLRVWVVPDRPAPAHFAPGRSLFVCTRSVNLAAGCIASNGPYPNIFFGSQPPLEGARTAGAPGWLPGVLVEVCRMKKAHFFLTFKNNQAHSLSNVFFVFKCNLERARVFPLA